MLRQVIVGCLICVLVAGCGSGTSPGTMYEKSAAQPTAAPASDAISPYRYQAIADPGAAPASAPGLAPFEGEGPGQGGDKYAHHDDNDFVAVRSEPLSTFSIDVDTASYSKARMLLLQHQQLPPPDAIRIEEWVNYFDYEYRAPEGNHPFATDVEVATCPWNAQHLLARVGIQGRKINSDRPPCNLVFLLDVSGSMNSANKLGLVQQSMRLLVSQLTERDRVAMVVYAGASGLVLPSTSGADKSLILAAIDQLQAGGSTNGGAGIQLAYRVAKEQLISSGSNRVILCTDGDFNVGVTSTGDLVRMAEQEAKGGVFLTVLGFGMGNHNDAMLEELSNKANGTYGFVDSAAEARRIFVDQIDGTLVTIAKDVKIQIEFNPAVVSGYRLLGYENRLLAAHEFNDDRKDAGEVGAGHCVTALYELIPAGSAEPLASVDPLKYQPSATDEPAGPPANADELMTVKLRYKEPDSESSQLLTCPVPAEHKSFGAASCDFRFAASVAEFGLVLRKSQYQGDSGLDAVLEIAAAALGEDRHGYRREFLDMVRCAGRITGTPLRAATMIQPVVRPPYLHYSPPQLPATISLHTPSSTGVTVWSVLAVGFVAYLVLSATVSLLICLLAILLSRRSHRQQLTPMKPAM